jgi:hypothetical protein
LSWLSCKSVLCLFCTNFINKTVQNVPESIRDCNEWLRCPLGSYCSGDGTKIKCPSGTIGDAEGLTSSACHGLCPAGYYCPVGSAEGITCGEGKGQYCPEGSSSPLIAAIGYYTTPYHKEESLGVRGGTDKQYGVKKCEGFVETNRSPFFELITPLFFHDFFLCVFTLSTNTLA